MAKLCRFYVSGAGNESARFNPLLIDLRDRHEWNPQNTIIWLRNGGGKTTLIALFYSIFVPKIPDFLGMKNGKGAKLPDFVRENELAVIATEWQPSELSAPRRTVGVVILKTPRELKRLFFSFSETKTTSFSFDSLPARGLSEAASNYDAFRERLTEAMRLHPQIELVLTENQSSWIQHLDSISLDTELFRTHLIMNSQEGGAADIFKIKNPEDFIKKFLELAYDETSTEEIEKSLQGFKEKRESAPHYAKSIEFGETLIRLLTPFSLDVAKRSKVKSDLALLNSEAAEVRFSIQSRQKTLNDELATLTAEISNYTETIAQNMSESKRLKSFLNGYKTLGRRFKVEETRNVLEVTVAAEKEAGQDLVILKAARELAAVRSINNEHLALVKERNKLHEELRPQLDEVRSLGAKLKAAWGRRIEDLAAALDLTKEQLQKISSKITELTDEKADLSSKITAAEKDQESARKAISKYEDAHRRLRSSDAIRSGEKADEALSRLKSEIWTLKNSIETLKISLGQMSIRLTSLRETLTVLNKSASIEEAIIEKLEGKLDEEEGSRIRIERLPIIEEIVMGGDVQFNNPYLLNRLDDIAEEAQAYLIQIGVLGADDQRDDLSLEKFGLLAPSADVESVVLKLAAQGIKTAMPVYHWLAEHCSPEKAALLFESNPAACSGILIQDKEEFQKAKEQLKKAAIRLPIVLLSSDPLQSKNLLFPEAAVVAPEETGMYSRADAAQSQTTISGRRDERAKKQNDFEARRASAHTAATRIREHLKSYSLERLKEWQEELTEARSKLTEFLSEIKIAKSDIANTEREIVESTQLKESQNTKMTLLTGQESEVTNFIREHERNIEMHRSQFASTTSQFESLNRELEENKIRTADLRVELDRINQSSLEQYANCKDAQNKGSEIPAEYVGVEVIETDVGRPEDLAPEFNLALANYKGLLKESDLDGRISAKSEELVKAKFSYDRAKSYVAKDTDVGLIEDASLAADIESEISEQNGIYYSAGQAKAVAKTHYDTAAKDNPTDSDFKSASFRDAERESQPITSEACLAVAAEYELQAQTLAVSIESAKETKTSAEKSLSRTETEQTLYKAMLDYLPEVVEAFSPHPQFSGTAEIDQVFVSELRNRITRNEKDLARTETAIEERFSKQIQPLITSPDYDPFRIEFRDRLKSNHKEDIAAKGEALIRDISTAVEACRNDLEHEDQHRRIIVEQLDDIVQRATRLLSQASEVSKMPAESGAWAHQPFLRIHVPKKSDKTERSVLLQAAMQRWYDNNNIPHGHTLAYHCLLAVCGTKAIGVKMLKPEYVPTATPYDIVDLMKFSDGEKLTAAILLYCVLVRLRARQRAKQFHFGSTDSGLLLLDNPIGKATLNEFVELQVNVARLMGVQLVYATGIGAESALKHFPHIVRLKNSERSRSNNDHYVTLESGDHVVEGITPGVRSR